MDDIEVEIAQGWSWQGAVAFALAVGVFITVNTMVIGLAWKIGNYTHADSVNPVTIAILTGVLSTLIGSLATFLGKLGDDTEGQPTTGVDAG